MKCTFDHPHPGHPCGLQIIDGVTRCSFCGNLDGSPECAGSGCWEPFTEADLDVLHAEAMGLHGVADQLESEGGRLNLAEAFAICAVLFFFFAVFWSAAHQ